MSLPAVACPEPVAHGSRPVLVVEDDAGLRSLIERSLSEEGFDVAEASTGADAIRLLSGAIPEVILMDVGLPDTNGFELCRAVRAAGITSPVLFVTARDSVADVASGLAAGGDGYLTKPFGIGELLECVDALIHRRV